MRQPDHMVLMNLYKKSKIMQCRSCSFHAQQRFIQVFCEMTIYMLVIDCGGTGDKTILLDALCLIYSLSLYFRELETNHEGAVGHKDHSLQVWQKSATKKLSNRDFSSLTICIICQSLPTSHERSCLGNINQCWVTGYGVPIPDLIMINSELINLFHQ